MKSDNWRCLKCSHHDCEVGQFAATGGGITRFLNIQNKKFSTISCKRCHYTEIYKKTSGSLTNIFDLLIGR